MNERVVWVYYVSRNSLGGQLADVCDLWWLKPTREKHAYRVTWVATDARHHGHLGEYKVSEIEAWFRVKPDTDLELIRVETYPSERDLAAAAEASKR